MLHGLCDAAVDRSAPTDVLSANQRMLPSGLENYHVIDLVGEGSFGKVVSSRASVPCSVLLGGGLCAAVEHGNQEQTVL